MLSSITSGVLIDNWWPHLPLWETLVLWVCVARLLLRQSSAWLKRLKINWMSATGMSVQMLWPLFIYSMFCTTTSLSCFVVVYNSSGNHMHKLSCHPRWCKKDKLHPMKMSLLRSDFYQLCTFWKIEVKVSKWESMGCFCVAFNRNRKKKMMWRCVCWYGLNAEGLLSPLEF